MTLPICRKPPSFSAISINCKSPCGRSANASPRASTALAGPTKRPWTSCSSTPNSLKYRMVSGRWIRVKIVRKPVLMDSALSRLVCRTLVKIASNSLRLPPADLNTPPNLRTAPIRSPDSTANAPATALIELSCPSRAPTPCLN